MNLVEFKNINKQFGDKKILKDINLVIPKGKIIGLLGNIFIHSSAALATAPKSVSMKTSRRIISKESRQ